MQNKSLITGGVIAAIVIGLILVVMFMQGGQEENLNQTTPPTTDAPKDQMIKESGMTRDESNNPEVMPGNNEKTMTDESMKKIPSNAPGSYKEFSSTLIASEAEAGNKVVLFFHAPWCPFCKAADEAFKTRTSEIPNGVVVLKTDYDSNTELKKKYGVTYQHTFVQVDGNGNMVTKWNGGDIDNLIKYIK